MYSLPKEIALKLIADYTVIVELIKDMSSKDKLAYVQKVGAIRGLCKYLFINKIMTVNEVRLISSEIETKLGSRYICVTPRDTYANPDEADRSSIIMDSLKCRIQWLKDNIENFQ